MCLCVCLSVREDVSGTTRAIFTNFVHVAYGRASVLLRRRWDTLCASYYLDDIIFFYNGSYEFRYEDRFQLNLPIYRKVGQNSFFISKGNNFDYFDITRKLK